MSLPPLSDDPEFLAATSALGRLLNGPPREEVLAKLQAAFERTKGVGGIAGAFASSLVEVLLVLFEWNGDTETDNSVHVQQILDAIERGMRI